MSTHLTITGTLPDGTRLGEFELIRVIGEGGFGIVYLAWDHSLERRVALKEYMPAHFASRVDGITVNPRSENHRETFEAGLRSFVNEARLLARFDHAALVKVYRFWEAHGTACMVMPYYEAGTLQSAVRAMPRPPDEAWLRRLLMPLCDALSMLHGAQCYHRDISPDNILLLPPADRPLLLDFGAARRVIGGMTHSLTSILKPGYAPIEQYAEVPGLRQGPATDVYALAATVHWIITGHTPPPAVARLLDDAYVPLEVSAAGRYSPEFLRAIDRALAVRPEMRTPDIDAFRKDLSARVDVFPRVTTREADPDSTIAHTLSEDTGVDDAHADPRPRDTPHMTAPPVATVFQPRPPEPTVEPAANEAPAPTSTSAPAKPRRSPLAMAAGVIAASTVAALAWTLLPADDDPGASAATADIVAPPAPVMQAPPERQAAQPPVRTPSADDDGIETILMTAPTAAGRVSSPTPPPEPVVATAPTPQAQAVETRPRPPSTGPAPRTAEEAADAVRKVECARLTKGGFFSNPSAEDLNRARRLGCG